MIYVLFAILCGVTNVLSRSVNFVLSDKIGMYQSTFFNYVFGLAGSILILLISAFSKLIYSLKFGKYVSNLVSTNKANSFWHPSLAFDEKEVAATKAVLLKFK